MDSTADSELSRRKASALEALYNYDSPDLDATNPDDGANPYDDEDGSDPDSAMAAAMGFSSFGGKPKARGHSRRGGGVNVGASAGRGANAVPVAESKRRKLVHPLREHGSRSSVAAAVQKGAETAGLPPQIDDSPNLETREQYQATDNNTEIQGSGNIGARTAIPTDRTQEIHLLRTTGLRLPGGDVAYFLPSFVEDPWALFEPAAVVGNSTDS